MLRMRRYSNLQIGIHWAVVLMIVTQWATSSAIPRTHNPLLPPAPFDLFLHMVHNYNGIAIGFLVLVRVALRLSRRAPREPGRPSAWDLAAIAVHWGIYVSLAAQAATGFIASYFWGPVAEVHKAIWNVTLTLLALHVSAAAWHGIRRDGVVGWMLPFRQSMVSATWRRPAR